MKNSGQCTKCRSTSIKRIEGSVGSYGTGNNILTGMTIFSAVKVTRFLCLNCGFSEEWVDDRDALEKISRNL